MAAYAIVRDGIVENIVEWDGESDWQPPTGSQAIPVPTETNAGIGSTYDGTTFSAPPPPSN